MLTLILNKSGKSYDISDLLEQAVWKGRKGSAARSLTVSLTDTDKASSGVDVTRGDSLMLYEDGEELFRGIAMTSQRADTRKEVITAYDNGIYLANNRDTFVFENKTVHSIFLDVCGRFGIKTGTAVNTSYKIPELTKSSSTAWDALLDAISQDYKATGAKYYISSEKGLLYLRKRAENILQYVLETSGNITAYNYKNSIEKINTRIKVLTKEDTVYAVEKNAELEKKIGIFQEIESKDDDLTDAQLKAQIKENLKEKSTPEETFNVTALGISQVISGVGVWVKIDHLGVARTYWVDEDAHTWQGDVHTMTLKLTKNNEVVKK
jgi:hypothetical protein